MDRITYGFSVLFCEVLKMLHHYASPRLGLINACRIFSNISERNNTILNPWLQNGWVGEVEVVTFFIFEFPDFKSAVLIYFYERTTQVAVLNWISWKFTWLVRVHPWMNPAVFRNSRPSRTADIGENSPPKPGFWLLFSRYGFFGGINLKTVFGTPFPTERVVFIFVVRRPVPSKMVVPSKNYFSLIVWKLLFFFIGKKVKWKIFKTSMSTKKVVSIFVARRPLPLKTVKFSHKWFLSVFFENTAFF